MEEKAVYNIDGKQVYLEALDKFGLDWLARLLKLFDDVRLSENRQGRIEIIIQDGRVHKIGGMKWVK